MKKAEADPMKVLVSIIILLVVAMILLFLYNTWFREAGKTGSGAIDLTKLDCDNDGLPDAIDPRMCSDDIDTSIKGCEDAKPKECS